MMAAVFDAETGSGGRADEVVRARNREERASEARGDEERAGESEEKKSCKSQEMSFV